MKAVTADDAHRDKKLPHARIGRDWRLSIVWIVPLLAAAFVGWLVYRQIANSGPSITIAFPNSYGVQGDGKSPIRFRGVNVGSVQSVQLSDDEKRVEVKAQLDGSAANLAREGTQFWVVHPEVGTGNIHGLQTIVSGDYIELKPGSGPRTDHFVGLDDPPVEETHTPGLAIALHTRVLGAVQRGTPIKYHDVKVGEVLSYELDPDGDAITINARIDDPYPHLVGTTSKFWKVGLDVDVRLPSIDIRNASISSLLEGGIDFATPGGVTTPATDGASFPLFEQPEPEWTSRVTAEVHGPPIVLLFDRADGLSAGAPLRYRGIDIGTVGSVSFASDHRRVAVHADLKEEAADLARGGAEWWIVHPQISLTEGVKGLSTLVSGSYVDMRPGAGPPQRHFVGLSEPPVEEQAPQGREIVLLAPQRSASRGDPLTFRGVKVGEIVSDDLGSDARVVEIRARIEPRYAALVRRNSKFWKVSGVDVNLSLLRGVSVETGSLQNLLRGGVAFATPDLSEPAALDGLAFRLYDKPEDPWLQWAPIIRIGAARAPAEPADHGSAPLDGRAAR